MDRVSAARDRLRSVKAELSSPAVAFPCIRCRYYELACTHPAVSKIAVSPVSGTAKAIHVSGEEARSETGACGPEGALFDSRSAPALVVVNVLSTSLGRWVALLAFVFLCIWVFG